MSSICGCCGGECWQQTVTFQTVTGQNVRVCSPEVKEDQTLSIPSGVCIPALALVTWSADDDISIDGVRLGNTCATSSGSKNICISKRSVQLALIDTVGINWAGTITIKICEINCAQCGSPLP